MELRESGDAALRRALDAVEAMIRRGLPDPQQGPVMRQLLACVKSEQVTPAALDAAVCRLATLARPLDLVRGTWAVYSCGLCIENGADAEPAAEVTLHFSKQSVRHAARLYRVGQLLRTQAEQESRTPPGPPPRLPAEATAPFADEDIVAGNMYVLLSPALFNVLVRSKAARKKARADGDFCRDAAAFMDRGNSPESAVPRVLQVLDDEELLVLHPRSGRGYRVVISGITHNFQLHTLLADVLIGDPDEGFLPGPRPDPRLVAAMRDQPHTPAVPPDEACFDLKAWTAIQPDGSVASGAFADAIPHEGTPADIPAVAGQRVVVLAPLTLPRTWNAPRDFQDLAGEADLVKILEPTEVSDWLERIARADRGGR